MRKGDKRKLISNLTVRTAISVGTIPKGNTVEIQQVDEGNRKVLVDNAWFPRSVIEDISEPISEEAK